MTDPVTDSVEIQLWMRIEPLYVSYVARAARKSFHDDEVFRRDQGERNAAMVTSTPYRHSLAQRENAQRNVDVSLTGSGTEANAILRRECSGITDTGRRGKAGAGGEECVDVQISQEDDCINIFGYSRPTQEFGRKPADLRPQALTDL